MRARPAPRAAPRTPPAPRWALVLDGPNLNLLGTREPEVYGHTTLEALRRELTALAHSLEVSLSFAQSNHEGALIDALHDAALREPRALGVVFNPGGYTHTSVALRDAIAAVGSMGVPTVEVHLTNVYARESFRHERVTTGACVGCIEGLGPSVYALALRALVERATR